MGRRASLILVLAACAHVSGREGIPGGPCGPEIPGSADVTARWSVVLVGEVHGTNEGPAAFGRLVCRAAERAHPSGVLVGLEIPSKDQAAIDAALAAADEAAARAELFATQHFGNELRDGRDSEAMLALLLELRRQRQAGLAIEVVAFDVRGSPGMDGDLEMAHELGAAIDAHPEATVLGYVGNAHAKRRKARTQPNVPMAARLLEDHPDLRTLDFATAGGTYWGCHGMDPATLDCGAKAASGSDRGPTAFVELGYPSDDFDGVLYVGPITASPPAKP